MDLGNLRATERFLFDFNKSPSHGSGDGCGCGSENLCQTDPSRPHFSFPGPVPFPVPFPLRGLGRWSRSYFGKKGCGVFSSAPHDKGLTTTGSNNVNRPGNRSRVLGGATPGPVRPGGRSFVATRSQIFHVTDGEDTGGYPLGESRPFSLSTQQLEGQLWLSVRLGEHRSTRLL